MALGEDAHVFPGFLTPLLTQLFFPKPPTTFLTSFCNTDLYITHNPNIVHFLWSLILIHTGHRCTSLVIQFSTPVVFPRFKQESSNSRLLASLSYILTHSDQPSLNNILGLISDLKSSQFLIGYTIIGLAITN